MNRALLTSHSRLSVLSKVLLALKSRDVVPNEDTRGSLSSAVAEVSCLVVIGRVIVSAIRICISRSPLLTLLGSLYAIILFYVVSRVGSFILAIVGYITEVVTMSLTILIAALLKATLFTISVTRHQFALLKKESGKGEKEETRDEAGQHINDEEDLKEVILVENVGIDDEYEG